MVRRAALNPHILAERLQVARDVIELGIAVCDLTLQLCVESCMFAVYETDGRPSLLVDNMTTRDEERLAYVTAGWLDDLELRALRQHHAPVHTETCSMLPILASGYVLGSIRCFADQPDDTLRRDLTTLASYVSVRAAELGIRTERDPSIAALTQRQLDVAHLLADGRTNAEISVQLGLSENTVKKHLKDVFARLGVTNRTECAARLRHDAPRQRLPVGVSRVGVIAITRTA